MIVPRIESKFVRQALDQQDQNWHLGLGPRETESETKILKEKGEQFK